ncbi:MAG: NADH-quinone oxidoreductase subunit E [Alphaproteobacteria bacterium]|nr:NADH-quinone oxidoreductase subunit E [Alphaproteobacteria bacterium]MBU0802198.1 NADH-quinone oxidoreductase subunit E [Alphaproteobacteria bacterium]MBU0870360.1 NADH-quinone oxidoreductase subunit E [Alphaproteobacteria bacterium]MBU1399697.1 NADH-quinone oxidoreductase subunit E [Alphaproteobacteria bacterium]MBU1590083.1 NADH-quinone oxidoreductase subunit E [Alphaproteobacteria bacterium]
MSVRRLADASEQPEGFAFNRVNRTWAAETVKKYPKGRQQSAVIPLMMRAQEQEGWLTKPAIEAIADMLDMPYIRALEVATFYTQFQLKPVGRRAHVQVCGTTPCMLRGAEGLMDVCRSKIHPEQFHTNERGMLSWEEVECLGACVNAPMVMIFKDTYEDLTPERLEEIIDQFAMGKGVHVPVGPQSGRKVSEPLPGLTSLTDEKAVTKQGRKAKAAKPAAAEDSASVPPSKAAKPKTRAAETNGAVKSPSPVKANQQTEKKESVAAPLFDPVAANKASPAVEKVDKQRKPPITKSGEVAHKSPELLRGEPIGAARKKSVASDKPSLSDANRPPKIDAPATPDNLKLISGVGPVLEGILHSLGIYTFAQVAAWTKAERDWVDGYLNFKGRIDRDDWVKQADALAKGEDEYLRVFGKKPV